MDILAIERVEGDLYYDYRAMRRGLGTTPDGRMMFFDGDSDIIGLTDPDLDVPVRLLVVFDGDSDEIPTLPESEPEWVALLESAARFYALYDAGLPGDDIRTRLGL